MKKYIIVLYNVNKDFVSAIVCKYPMEFDHAIRQLQKTPVKYPNTVLKLVEIEL
jgi:hypothetical protein